MILLSFHPDFEASCRICGTSPCVVVANHPVPDTDLCGPHFFHNTEMNQWEDWNEEYSGEINEAN